MTLAAVQLAPLVVSLLVGVVIPHLVDLVTHSTAPDRLKSFLAFGLAAATGALTTIVADPGQDWKVYVLNVIAAFLTAFASHTAGASEFVQRATGDVGIGKRPVGLSG